MMLLVVILIPFVLYCATSLLRKRSKNNQQTLKNQVVIITGASSGLGRALAFAFYCNGSRLVLCSRNVSKLEALKKELQQTCDTSDTPICTVMELDITDTSSIAKSAKEIISSFSEGIYVLVNNAGMSYRGGISSTAVDVDRKVMDVNYFGHVDFTKQLLPALKKRKNQISLVTSHVVYINSIQGKISIPHRSCYAASKFAATAFYDCLRSEVADCGINVCAVFPSYIKTDISLNAVTGDGSSYGKLDENTMRGMDPDEVASRIVQAVLSNEQEIYISDVKSMTGVLLRWLLPGVYFWYMKRRARNEKTKVL